MVPLLDLPEDLLVILPDYLDSVNDLVSLIQTCHGLYRPCHNSQARLSPRLHRRGAQRALQPYPHLLIAANARTVGDWAVQSVENRNAFHAAITGGLNGLAELCFEVSRVSLGDMRRLHQLR